MVVSLRRLSVPGGRVAVLGSAVEIGRDPACDLVVDDVGVRPRHARLRHVKGEWVLSAQGDAPLWVNGRSAPLFPLRSGDRIGLLGPGEGPGALAFQDELAGAFVPPGASRLGAWFAVAGARPGPGRLGAYGVHLGGVDLGGGDVRGADVGGADVGGPGGASWEFEGRTPEEGQPCRLLLEARPQSVAACEGSLAAWAAWAAAPHPRLAHVCEVGALPQAGGARPWLAHALVEGRPGTDLLAGPPPDLGTWIGAVADLARALAWLHRRWLRHGALGPASVVLEPEGRARLLPTLALRGWREALPPLPAAERTPGFRASEEQQGAAGGAGAALDVHDLGALAAAWFAGHWAGSPARGTGPHAAAGRRAPRVADLGLRLPPELERLLDRMLDPEPARRPNATDVARTLEGLGAVWGLSTEEPLRPGEAR